MRILCGVLIFLTVTSLTLGAQRVVKGAEPPYPPASGTARFSLHPAPASLPQSLRELCDSSPLIVQAAVHSTFSPRNLGGLLETDVVLLVTQVLKGATSVRQLVVAQRGGILGQYQELPVQYSLMQPGEQYIAFLTADRRTNVPERTGIPRHWISGEWVGLFRIDNGIVHLTSGTPKTLQDKFEGMNLEQAIAEIRSCITPKLQ